MGLAKVWNDGPTDYVEEFRGEKISIPKGKYIEMDRYDAAAFLSQYVKPKKTDTGLYLNHKQLRAEAVPDASEVPVEHRCHACRGLFASENELLLHTKAFHEDRVVAAVGRAEKEQPLPRTK